MKPVIWTEGAFLSQQHFQYWQSWLLEHQNMMIRTTSPDAYGLVSCEIDAHSLGLQKAVIRSLILRTEKGSWVIYEESKAKVLATPLEDLESQFIYLNVPRNELCSGLSGYEAISDQAAYTAEYVQVEDHYDSKRMHEITLGVPQLRISTQPLDLQLYESWPILKCKRIVGAQYEIDHSFIPQCLNLKACQSLIVLTQEILQALSQKMNYLREQIERSTEQGFKEQYGLVSEVYLEVSDMESHGLTHPRVLYQSLAKLLMKLGLMRGKMINVESYHHQASGEHISFIRDQLIQALSEEIETLPSFILKKETHPYPSLDNINQEYLQGYSWYLGVDFSHQTQDGILKFPTQAKLGTVKTLDQMIASALPGIKLSHQLRAPKQIRSREGYEYFKLDHEGLDWRHVKDERSFMIYLPSTFEGQKITLDIVKD